MKNIRASALAVFLVAAVAGCAMVTLNSDVGPGSPGPQDQGDKVARNDGNARRGKQVFRYETFGNEGFWTGAVRLPQGLVAEQVTPMQALKLGLNVDVLKVPLDIALRVVFSLIADPTLKNAKVMNDPAITIRLIKANAVIGFAAKEDVRAERIDSRSPVNAGATCALCHTIVKAPLFQLAGGGGIGFRDDGRANHSLDFGRLMATAANSRALFPSLQLALAANGGKSFGRAPRGLTENSTEAEVDAYLSNPAYYPVGMFDDSLDGNGNTMHNSPLFRQDLAAPFGSEGSIARLDNFSNLVYTGPFDPTNITTPGGRAFIHKLGGAAGDEMVESYVRVLAATGVTGYPYVRSEQPANPGSEDAPLGIRVDERKLEDLNAYLVGLSAPRERIPDPAAAVRGRELFRTGVCIQCHNADQSKPVPSFVVPMKQIFPGDSPIVLARRSPPLNPVMDTPGNTFDDKMAVTNASMRGLERGTVMPLLLDLARKPNFLHDNSVASLPSLLSPERGPTAPHPFYIEDARAREDMVEFLRGLNDRPN